VVPNTKFSFLGRFSKLVLSVFSSIVNLDDDMNRNDDCAVFVVDEQSTQVRRAAAFENKEGGQILEDDRATITMMMITNETLNDETILVMKKIMGRDDTNSDYCRYVWWDCRVNEFDERILCRCPMINSCRVPVSVERIVCRCSIDCVVSSPFQC
jgi:hypothetical protein